MRVATIAVNNDYYDEDYLKALRFKAVGKNVRMHRSVVVMDPSKISINDNITIGPYCVFGYGVTHINANTEPFTYLGNLLEDPVKADADRIKELEALLAATKANDVAKVKNE